MCIRSANDHHDREREFFTRPHLLFSVLSLRSFYISIFHSYKKAKTHKQQHFSVLNFSSRSLLSVDRLSVFSCQFFFIFRSSSYTLCALRCALHYTRPHFALSPHSCLGQPVGDGDGLTDACLWPRRTRTRNPKPKIYNIPMLCGARWLAAPLAGCWPVGIIYSARERRNRPADTQ